MRHRFRGRKLGRNPSHRKAMLRNMACSLIRSVRVDEDDKNKPRVPGRIVTTVAKAKELRPFVEKLVTMARKSIEHRERAAALNTSAERNSAEWKRWRESEQWNSWNQAIAPAVALRRRAFAALRDSQAVQILFDELADRFAERPGGYTRVVQLSTVRLGDSGKQALIEFVGERDRVKVKRRAPLVTERDESEPETSSTPAAKTPDEATSPEGEQPVAEGTQETPASEGGSEAESKG